MNHAGKPVTQVQCAFDDGLSWRLCVRNQGAKIVITEKPTGLW
jgi:hypothetical protein